MKYELVCTDCSKRYHPDQVEYLCPACVKDQKKEETMRGVLRVEYNTVVARSLFTMEGVKRSSFSDHRRYMELLPIERVVSLPPLRVGPTPLEPVLRLRDQLGCANLYIKNDTSLPTGSFKDRASSLVVAKARELKKDVVTTASTGNAATALAGMSASVGLQNIIFVPKAAPKAKLTQIAMFGATLIPVDGTYDDAFQLSIEATEKYGWYNRNTAYNPYTVEGKKTAALEIWEQLSYQVPDKILIPTGDGVILAGTYKGFYDLKAIGLTDKIPQMIPVQAEGSAAIIQALETGADHVSPLSKATTIADSISVASPSCGNWALQIIRETNGFGITVTDDDILSGMKSLASATGIFAEPAAAAAYAGLLKGLQDGKISPKETVIVMITGSGLKDISAAMKAIEIPEPIAPTLDALDKHFGNI